MNTKGPGARRDPRLVEIEIKKAEAELESELLSLELKRIEVQEKQSEAEHKIWQRAREEAKEDSSYGLVRIDDQITMATITKARRDLRELAVLRPGEPIRVEINSVGGSVTAGFDLFDEIRRISGEIQSKQKDSDKRPAITTVVTGKACSMGSLLVQAGDWRLMGRNAYFHMHSVASGDWGKLEQLEDTVGLIRKQTWHAAWLYAERATAAGRWLTAERVFEMIKNRELWLNSGEALELGFVDEVA